MFSRKEQEHSPQTIGELTRPRWPPPPPTRTGLSTQQTQAHAVPRPSLQPRQAPFRDLLGGLCRMAARPREPEYSSTLQEGPAVPARSLSWGGTGRFRVLGEAQARQGRSAQTPAAAP